jgi:hypothetical protein
MEHKKLWICWRRISAPRRPLPPPPNGFGGCPLAEEISRPLWFGFRRLQSPPSSATAMMAHANLASVLRGGCGG